MTASGTEYTIVSLEKGTPVHGGSWITFEAPEDNYYTFTFEKDSVIDESLTKEEPLQKGSGCGLSRYQVPQVNILFT